MNDQKIELTLTIDELNVLLAGLGKLPLEMAVAVFGNVKVQADAQLQKPKVE